MWFSVNEMFTQNLSIKFFVFNIVFKTFVHIMEKYIKYELQNFMYLKRKVSGYYKRKSLCITTYRVKLQEAC